MLPFIHQELEKIQTLIATMRQDKELLTTAQNMTQVCIDAIASGHKILFAGNGGSAADAQHLAAELVGRLRYDRPALPSIALTTDTSALTCIANDYGFNAIYERQIEALGQKGDVFIGISTSGNSANILRALDTAQKRELHCLGFSGLTGGKMRTLCQQILRIPSEDTQKIQEGHIIFGHMLCGLIETHFQQQLTKKHHDATVTSI